MLLTTDYAIRIVYIQYNFTFNDHNHLVRFAKPRVMHPLAPKQQVKLCTEIDAYSKRRTQTLCTWLKDNASTISYMAHLMILMYIVLLQRLIH